MNKLSTLDWVALVLVIVGAVNWGLVGVFGLDLVDSLFGSVELVAKAVYVLVGLSGAYLAATATSLSRR